MVARRLVKISDNVPVRLLNVTDEIKRINKNTVVGNLSPVEPMEREVSKTKDDRETKLPSTVQQLFDESTKGLEPEQSRMVYDLLLKYSSVFAKDDSDLGRTNVVRHKICTDGSKPVKQPLRRFPPKMAK